MCGIFGVHLTNIDQLSTPELKLIIDRLYILSLTRGKEASGIAIANSCGVYIYKDNLPASKFIKENKYIKFFRDSIENSPKGSPITIIGHTRLVTNGLQDKTYNNQPVLSNGICMVHNGIITNDASLWAILGEEKPSTDVDTEVLSALIGHYTDKGSDIYSATGKTLAQIEGNASIAFISKKHEGLYLATNTGSIYHSITNVGADPNDNLLIFASERLILVKFFKNNNIKKTIKPAPITRLAPNQILGKFSTQKTQLLPLNKAGTCRAPNLLLSKYREVEDFSRHFDDARTNLRRCTKCILPETMPFISFDDNGVCNYCRSYQPMQVEKKEKALELVAPLKHKQGKKPNSLVMLSGGRDSCYGLHYAVTELGLNPIAYTYDWGMVTDIARRNASRICGKLGVEHIVVSADIAWKRRNIRKNINAWLHKPKLGMVPLFMAGDKQYYYYANQIQKANNLPITLVSECPLELTRFKAGFCGVDESKNRIFNIPLSEKMKLGRYYAAQYIQNIRYFNTSILDSVFAFWSSYFMKHDYMFIYNYDRWEEGKIVKPLIEEYGWETDPGASSTWRIGDGSAAFYNYIYYTIAGFTENDTLRSNQIREGMITRTEALDRAHKENQPRWDALEWYAATIGFNLLEAIQIINRTPKLYYFNGTYD